MVLQADVALTATITDKILDEFTVQPDLVALTGNLNTVMIPLA